MVARRLKVYRQRIQTIFDAYAEIAYQECCRNGIEAPKYLGCDETSTHKGHEYITVVVNMETGTILALVEDGKSSESLLALQKRMDAPETVQAVSLDMSPAFIKASIEDFPSALQTFNRFHVVRLVNRAFDNLHRPKSALQRSYALCKTAFRFSTSTLLFLMPQHSLPIGVIVWKKQTSMLML